MIVGRQFAIGHIPKCGGDAAHEWCRALNDHSLLIDPTDTLGKHDPFIIRPEARGKQFYVLAIRRLPEWTLSLLHEDSRQPELVAQWGFSSAKQMLQPEAAFKHAYGDFLLGKMRCGVDVTHWLRCGATLLDDLIAALKQVHRPLLPNEIAVMRAVETKRPRPYCHDVTRFWSRRELENLYRLNPQWAAIESLVYSGVFT